MESGYEWKSDEPFKIEAEVFIGLKYELSAKSQSIGIDISFEAKGGAKINAKKAKTGGKDGDSPL